MPSSLEGAAPLPGDEHSAGVAGTRSFRGVIVAFGRFWWDFLVGETPELLVGSVIAVGAVALLAHNQSVRAVTVAALPVLVVLVLGFSAWRAARRR